MSLHLSHVFSIPSLYILAVFYKFQKRIAKLSSEQYHTNSASTHGVDGDGTDYMHCGLLLIAAVWIIGGAIPTQANQASAYLI